MKDIIADNIINKASETKEQIIKYGKLIKEKAAKLMNKNGVDFYIYSSELTASSYKLKQVVDKWCEEVEDIYSKDYLFRRHVKESTDVVKNKCDELHEEICKVLVLREEKYDWLKFVNEKINSLILNWNITMIKIECYVYAVKRELFIEL